MKNPTNTEATELQNKAQETTITAAETEITDGELETIAGGFPTTPLPPIFVPYGIVIY